MEKRSPLPSTAAKKPSTTSPNLAQADGPAVRSRNSSSGIKKSQGSAGQTSGSAGGTFSENDTFNKHYNKELRVSKDEIPIVLGELNDSAIQFIKREQWEKALNLLQKAYGIMDVVDFSLCRRDKFNLFILFHNMALCYQKLQMLEECAQCIEQALEYMPADQFSLEERSVSNRMRKLQLVCKLKLQYCAILSQVHRHKDALEQSREGVRISHHLANDMRQLCEFYIKREDIEQSYGNINASTQQQPPSNSRNNPGIGVDTELTYNSYRSQRRERRKEAGASRNRSFSQFLSQQEAGEALLFQQSASVQSKNFPLAKVAQQQDQVSNGNGNLSSFYSLNFLEESMSYLERTARKLLPILAEIKKRMVPEKNLKGGKRRGKVETLDSVHEDLSLAGEEEKDQKKQGADMKNILGYLNQGEWTVALSIGSIMQLQPFSMRDLLEQGKNELELTRESFIQKVSLIAVAYFCYSTEIRFILQMKEDPSYDPSVKQKESEYWHAKALEIACTFLPSECPLLNHINLSYQKHFAPVKQTIMEEEEVTDDLKVVKPLNGIDNPKFQPIIRQLQGIQVAITPYQMTPLNQITSQFLSQMVSFNEYQEHGTNHQASIKSQLGASSVHQLHSKSRSGDMTAAAGSHKRVTTADPSLLQGKLPLDAGEDDLQKFERLLDKLIKENKIDRLDLLRKFQAASSSEGGKLVLEERESSNLSQDMLLDEHIMAEEDSQLIEDDDHIASEAQHQAVAQGLYKFRNPETERPKTSTQQRDEKGLSHAERINQYHKHMEEKKMKANGRPLSGGLQQKVKSESQKSRVNKASNAQNLSMYEKFGAGMALGSSPEKHQLSSFQANNNQPKGVASSHSQFLTTGLNQQPPSQQSSKINSHLQQQQQKLNFIQSSSSQIVGQKVNSSAPVDVGKKQGGEPSNIQAYDELKKRLLSEYKKLTSGKKSFDEQVREKYKNLKQRAVSGTKKPSSQVPPQPTGGSAPPQPGGASGYQPQALSPRHHLNVYKPTFIINNSFAGEGGATNPPGTNSKDIEILDELSKKYRPSSKQGTQTQYPSAQQPSGRSASIGSGLNPVTGQVIQPPQSQSFHHERQSASFGGSQLNNQQLLGMLINQDKKNPLGTGSIQKKPSAKGHHQQQLSQPAPDLNYVKQYIDKPGANQLILGVSGPQTQSNGSKPISQMKPASGYSSQQQFNQFSQLQQQQQQQQLQPQQYPLGSYKGGASALEQQLHQKRTTQGASSVLISQPLTASGKAPTQSSQYEKLKKKIANY